MNPASDPNDPLERFVSRALRELPARRAPSTLEARVLAEIARLAALPWWKKSYTAWPTVVRQAFFIISAATAAGIVAGLFSITGHSAIPRIAGEIVGRLEWISLLRTTAQGMASLGSALFASVPPIWLYGGAGALALAYAALLGAGAAAYRAFAAPR